MHTEPRNGAQILRIYVHTNEGPEQEGGAQGLVNFLQHEDGGYHAVVDDKQLVRAAADNLVVWGEGGDNQHALSICFVGYANQTPAQWDDAFSRGEFALAVNQIAEWCKTYGVPAIHVRPGAPGQAPTDAGIAEHADDHNASSDGHTDPGPNFPMDTLVSRVAAQLQPPIDWQALARLAAWAKRVSANPLHAGDTGPDVVIAKQLLAHAGFDVGNVIPAYGAKFTAIVHAFKLQKHLPNADGRTLGRHVVKALGL